MYHSFVKPLHRKLTVVLGKSRAFIFISQYWYCLVTVILNMCRKKDKDKQKGKSTPDKKPPSRHAKSR